MLCSFLHQRSRESACSLVCDDFVQPFDYLCQFFFGHLPDPFTNPFDGPLCQDRCRARKIDPNPSHLVSDVLQSTNERVWSPQLSAVMATVPSFAQVWQDWQAFCKTLLLMK